MKGYHTDSGFKGYLDGRYVLFASDTDYYDYLEETADANETC